MTRIAIVLAAAALIAAAGAAAKSGLPDPALHGYVAKVDGQIRSYGGLLRRFEQLYAEPPHVNVDPFVEDLYGLADRFERLSARWSDIRAPGGLRLRHHGMGRVFELFAEAIRLQAAAIFTRHPEEVLAAQGRIEPFFRSATYLQQRWAHALRGALIRADMNVPSWLHGMAKGS
jgi:hypothetical protein